MTNPPAEVLGDREKLLEWMANNPTVAPDGKRVSISGLNLSGIALKGAKFTEAQIQGAAFDNCDLTGAEFDQAMLVDAGFERAVLDGDLTPKLFTSTNRSNTPMQRLLTTLGYVPSGIIYNLDRDDPELVYFRDLGESAA